MVLITINNIYVGDNGFVKMQLSFTSRWPSKAGVFKVVHGRVVMVCICYILHERLLCVFIHIHLCTHIHTHTHLYIPSRLARHCTCISLESVPWWTVNRLHSRFVNICASASSHTHARMHTGRYSAVNTCISTPVPTLYANNQNYH